CGLLATGMQVGAIAASLLTGPLIVLLGWRIVFACYAVPSLAWAVLFWNRFRNTPHDHAGVNAAERSLIREDSNEPGAPSDGSTATPWRAILTNSSVWFLCGQQACRAAGYMFFASWFPTFLQETQDVSVKESGYLQALVFAGTLVGSIWGGLLTDWIWRRTGSLRWSRSGVGAAFLICCAALILCAWGVNTTLPAVALLSLGALSSALCGPSAYSAAIDIGGEHTAQVFGLMNMSGNLATAACPILLGELFSRTDNWQIALLAFAVIFIVGAVCWMLVDSQRTVCAVR
ncbi:MAG: MFS transporter, partial [Pseudomonadales bacterium]|nr:MFS transporter [Pseudomonadales bacterium]